MRVHYYGIANCFLEQYGTSPVLIAPENYSVQMMQQYGFVQLSDGRWAHYLTEAEFRYIQTTPIGSDAVFSYGPQAGSVQGEPQLDPESKSKADKLTWGSIASWVIAIILAQIEDLQVIVPVFSVISLVLIIIARVKYKQHRFSKVMMTVYLVLLAVGIAMAVIAGLVLVAMCNSCVSSCDGHGM